MPDLSMLNTIIAMVIVILVLSLVVQSCQTLVKKLMKLKSRSILHSLEDLFETVGTKEDDAANTSDAKQLVSEVTNRLKDMGRKTLFGQPMLDSLAKGDLLKVLTRVKAEDLLPGTVKNFQTVLSGINQLKIELASIETTLLQGGASAKFAAMQGSIMPLIHDLEALAKGGNIDPAVFFGDLYKLRQLKATEVLTILGEVQKDVGTDLSTAQKASDEAGKALAAAQQANNPAQIAAATASEAEAKGKLTAVQGVDAGLKRIADQISKASNAFDVAFAPLFARLQQVEVWYDTVMQGFEERYTRHMKTVGIVISILVVVILNANFFSIYRSIKSDPVKTALIVEQTPAILKLAEQEATRQQSQIANKQETPSPTPSTSPSPTTSPTDSPTPETQTARVVASPATTPSPTPTESPITVADLKTEAEQVNQLVKTYESFGIKPLSRGQLHNLWAGNYLWRDVNETILGWAIMIMLLSAGAPFWQDTLESLFGLKNLLRQKSDTKNVEGEKGGQPRP